MYRNTKQHEANEPFITAIKKLINVPADLTTTIVITTIAVK
jgi:hypothetical protein